MRPDAHVVYSDMPPSASGPVGATNVQASHCAAQDPAEGDKLASAMPRHATRWHSFRQAKESAGLTFTGLPDLPSVELPTIAGPQVSKSSS